MIARLEVKKLFFDRKAVKKAVDGGFAKAFTRFGFQVRQTARGKIRKPTKSTPVSKPGKPPRSHTGLLRDNIFFYYNHKLRNVTIGPVALNAKGGAKTPGILEQGGNAVIRRRRRTWLPGRRNKNTRRVYIKPRPYMKPSFDYRLKKLPDLMKNKVTIR
jgi:hypothetical protein